MFCEHLVAARDRVLGEVAGRVGARRGDHPRRAAPPPRAAARRRTGRVALAAAGVVVAEVGPRGGLDPGRALAEVDLVQVLGEDLVLRPLALEVVGERRLAQLLEHGPAVLGGERVLDELLGDRRGALLGGARAHVLPHGAGDALEVDPAVLVEALVLDRDHRLLHHRGDLVGGRRTPGPGCWSASPACCRRRRRRPSSRPACTARGSRARAGPGRPPS